MISKKENITYILLFIFYVIATIVYIYLYPNPIDWDGFERFNSSIILYDLMKDIFFGNLNSVTDILNYLLEYKEDYRTGQGLIIWPPLQVAMLTFFIAGFGKSIFTIYIYSYLILFIIFIFLKKIFDLLELNKKSSIFIILLFFTNPIFMHHIFTLNLRFGEVLAIIFSMYALIYYEKSNAKKYIYMIAVVSVLSVFYRLTALVGVLPFGIAMLFIVKNKKDLIKPFVVVLFGIMIFFGLHYIETHLVGQSFLERVSRNYGSIDLEGFYTYYQFSDYYKGLSSIDVAKLADYRYELNTLQKFIFGFSGLVFSGLIFIFVFVKKYNIKNKISFYALFGTVILYLLLISRHGAKPDYLLPLLFSFSMLLLVIGHRFRDGSLFIFSCLVIIFNLFGTYTRYIHPYYEDINIALLQKNKIFFDNIDTVYVANTPMKHIAYFSITNDKMFKVVEFAKVDMKEVIRNLKNNELVVLNNSWNYRFANINYVHFKEIIEENRSLYQEISLDSYQSHYILLKKK
jgi:hypothetical protein